MLVEQAIFTSADTSIMRGYQLVSRSLGISNTDAAEINRWSPSHDSLLCRDIRSQSLNFYPLCGDRYVVSRTLHGGREFSQRGGWQVVTISLVIRSDQLRQYDNNPVALARVARSLGYLRWQLSIDGSVPLTRVELPDGAASESLRHCEGHFAANDAWNALRNHESIAILTNEPDRLGTIEALMYSVGVDERPKLSFTTGLKPAAQRPFRVHVMPNATSAAIRNKLAALGMRSIKFESETCR